MKYKLIFLIAYLFSHLLLVSNLNAKDTQQQNSSSWNADSISEYAGSYHFGESEGESSFYLIHSTDGAWFGQIRSGSFNEDGSDWVMNYQNLSNIKIDSKGNFSSSEYNGSFVKVNDDKGKELQGLKIQKPWTIGLENTDSEIGIRTSQKFSDLYQGEYTIASFRKLSTNDLESAPKNKLQLMRNEIFARYGYIFKKGGTIDKHFKTKKWYRGQHKNVDKFLTGLEKENIKLIRQVESQK